MCKFICNKCPVNKTEKCMGKDKCPVILYRNYRPPIGPMKVYPSEKDYKKSFWERLDKLEELANKVKVKTWEYSEEITGDPVLVANNGSFNVQIAKAEFAGTADDIKYIAAANPEMLLELISEIRQVADDNLHEQWREAARKALEESHEKKLKDSFESYGISIENIFLFDYYVAKPISECHALNDVLALMDENEIRQIFGNRLAKYIIAEDPDLAAYFQEAGGVFIDAECDYPDWKHVEFFPNTDKPRAWLNASGRRIIRAYALTLEEALENLVTKAETIENTELEKVIAARH